MDNQEIAKNLDKNIQNAIKQRVEFDIKQRTNQLSAETRGVLYIHDKMAKAREEYDTYFKALVENLHLIPNKEYREYQAISNFNEKKYGNRR